MLKDGTDLVIADCAKDYGRFCENIALERRVVRDIQDARMHPNAKAEHHALMDRLAKEYRFSLPLLERPPQFSLRLDIYPSKEEMIKITESNGHIVSDYARGVIGHKNFLLYTGTEIFDFIPGTVKEVTGKDLVKTPELYETMLRLGFVLAPHPSACAIRNEYTDQPMDEWRSVLSDPVPGTGGNPSVLDVGRDSRGSFVGRRYAYPVSRWRGDDRLLLCRKRQLAT